jgi:hypothetical protein
MRGYYVLQQSSETAYDDTIFVPITLAIQNRCQIEPESIPDLRVLPVRLMHPFRANRISISSMARLVTFTFEFWHRILKEQIDKGHSSRFEVAALRYKENPTRDFGWPKCGRGFSDFRLGNGG